MTLRELRKSDFVEALEMLDKEDDINKVSFTKEKQLVLPRQLDTPFSHVTVKYLIYNDAST